MKVLLVHSRYRSHAPSGENRVVDQEAAQLRHCGHDVEMFQRYSDAIAEFSPRQKATLPIRSIRNSEVRTDLERRLRQGRYDVVHVHNTFPMLSPSVLHACSAAGVPVVATIHNYKLLCASGDFFRDGSPCHRCADGSVGSALRLGCYRDSRLATLPVVAGNLINRPSWRRLVSAYMFISAAPRDLMRGLGLPRSRVFVKHNFVHPPEETVSQREHAVVYLGRLDAAKGVPFLMRAWDAFQRRHPGSALRLVIAGGGPLEHEVQRWAAGHPRVRVAGNLSRDDAGLLLRSALAAVVPSQWEETFGLVVAEAMSAAVAPIASARGSFCELITDGVDGKLFDAADPDALADTFAEVDREPDRYRVLGAQGRITAQKKFDPVANIDELIRIYRFAMDNPISGSNHA
jgi:glycosyltransferase involved in cell wall biosynthesis